MLSTPSATASPIILDLQRDNWSQWHQLLKLSCFTKFGVAGQQILSDHLIPLQPFAIEPTKNDLDSDQTGQPIPNQFTYSRRNLTLEEAADPTTNPLLIQLSAQGNTDFRDDRKIYTAAARRSSDEDTECLDHLYKNISHSSHTSTKTHPNYPAYQLLAIGHRSYAFYRMVRDIHSIGNAATKLHRTRLYANISQADLPHEEYMDLVTTMADTFKLDFESAEFPGYVSLQELTSFLYLAGLNRSEFRRALDELLHNHPTGRFPDPIALMSQLQSWKVANSLSFTRDEVSTQGSALVASKQRSPNPTTPKDQPAKQQHLHPTHRTWCFSSDKVKRFGHLSSHCSKNPNRILGPSPPPRQSAGTHPTPTSQRLRALLGQLDQTSDPDASNAAMLLIAEAAIEASEYPDSA